MEELEAALVKQLQTDTAVEKLEEQRKMFMSKLEELETALSQKHNEVIEQTQDIQLSSAAVYRISSNRRHPRIIATQSGALSEMHAALD